MLENNFLHTTRRPISPVTVEERKQANLFLTPESPTHSSEVRLREQEGGFLQKCKSMEEFKQIHARVLKLGLHHNSHAVANFLSACALSSWGCMDYAGSIFQQIDNPTAFLFNTMIRGFVNDSNPKAAILLYREMQVRDVKPDNFTYPFVLKGCSHLSAILEGKQIHGQVYKFGLESDIYVQNSLTNMYGKYGEIKLSCRVFDKMEKRSIASWSALIAAHTNLGLWAECINLFLEMICQGWRPDESTLVSVLSSCAHLGALDFGRTIHGALVRKFCGLNVIVETSLMDMYVKSGCLEKGLCIFDNMPSRNAMCYSVMISGFALHGEGERALGVFSEMLREGLKPDEAVYVGVLSACSHAGLVEEGFKCFDRMRFEHGVEPTIQHYGCMVDLLGRAGKLMEAFEFIQRMPIKPNDVVWRSLLSACKVHNDLKLGEFALRNILQLKTYNRGDYVLLSNLYAKTLQWSKVAKVRTKMVEEGSSHKPAFSMVEVRRKLHKFVSQDKSHPQSEEIHEMLYQMGWQLMFEGYSPDTSQVLFNVDEEEKRRLLSAHSQKLAIAFSLLHTSQGSPIRVVKNLRMCSDCHTYTKYISKIYERTIIIRDRNRFHHFREGNCSCEDYW